MTWRAVVVAACVLASGCAREPGGRPAEAWTGAPPIALRAQETRRIELPEAMPAGSAPAAPVARYTDPAAPGTGAAPPAPLLLPTHLSSATIPDGSACLSMLDALGVPYARMEHERGIGTPVVVRGPIGGIDYRAFAKVQLVADCRLVVALAWIAPILRDEGVTEARFSGAYSYRMSRVGRLSLHAYGLAIDVHELVVGGRRLTVQRNFARGLGGCSPSVPSLNRIACRLKALGLFRELLTPDSNADHYNHFHFGILPTGMTLAMLPRAPKPTPAHRAVAKHATPAEPDSATRAAAAKHKSVHRPLLVEEEAGVQLIEEPDPPAPKHGHKAAAKRGHKEKAAAKRDEKASAKRRHRAEPTASPPKDAARSRHRTRAPHPRRAEATHGHRRHRKGDKARH